MAKVSYKDRVTNEEVLSRLGVERGLLSQAVMTARRKQFSQVEKMVEEEGADPDVSGTTTSKNGLATSSIRTSSWPRNV